MLPLTFTPTADALLAAIRECRFESEPKRQLIDYALEHPEPFLAAIVAVPDRAASARVQGSYSDPPQAWVYHPRELPDAVREFAAALAWAAAMDRGPIRRQNCSRALTAVVDRRMPGYLPQARHTALAAAAVTLGYRWMPSRDHRIYLGVTHRFDAAPVPPLKQRPRHIDPDREWNPWTRQWE